MNYDDILQMWIGSNKAALPVTERNRGNSFWFRRNIMFQHEIPLARLERTLQDGLVLLSATNIGSCYWPTSRDAAIATYRLPSIGVFSHADGDMLDGYALHQHIHHSFHCRAWDVLYDVKTMPITRLLRWYRDEEVARNVWRGQAEGLAHQWNNYREAFCPELEPLPINIAPEVDRIVCERWQKYHSPKAVAKRERRDARVNACVALGIAA
jgi:hypothetical protein